MQREEAVVAFPMKKKKMLVCSLYGPQYLEHCLLDIISGL